MCVSKLFAPKQKKGPSAEELVAQQQAVEKAAAQKEAQRIAEMRGRSTLNNNESKGQGTDELGGTYTYV